MNRLRVVPAVLLLCGCVDPSTARSDGPPGTVCGDGTLYAPTEACDQGPDNGPNAACSTSCTRNFALCGDGVVQAFGGEACDEGEANDDLFGACTTECREARCGDGTLDEDEECDAGRGNSNLVGSCTRHCTVADCGDGVRSRGEACDGTPGCSSSCRLLGCGARQIVAWAQTTLVLLDDGRLLGAGATERGELGVREPPAIATLRPVHDELRFRRVALQQSNGAGITEAGALVIWGLNEKGQFGDGSSASFLELQEVDPGPGWVDLALGRDTLFALRDDGAVFGAGDELARFGAERPQSCPVPVDTAGCDGLFRELVPAGRGFVSLSAGDEHLVALDVQGVVHTWGCGSTGELGRGGLVPSTEDCPTDAIERAPRGRLCDPVPTPIPEQQAAAVLAVAGARSTLWLDRDGALFAAGFNCGRYLGLTEEGFVSTPEESGPRVDQRRVPLVLVASGGRSFGAALDATGGLWSYGAAFDSFFSNPLGRMRSPEMQLEDLDELAVGDKHTLVRTKDGTVHVIGSNQHGQRGTGEPLGDEDLQYWSTLDLSPFCPP